jgi:hypothetical protein
LICGNGVLLPRAPALLPLTRPQYRHPGRQVQSSDGGRHRRRLLWWGVGCLPRSHQEDCHDRRRVERPPDGKTITEYELEQCQRANQTGADARSWRGHPWSGHLCGEVEVVGMPTAASLPSASSPALVL